MNGKNEMITLISITTTQDADGFNVETRTERNVFGDVRSVSGQEFYQTGLLNIQAELDVTIWHSEYNGEKLAKVNGKTYVVYRTYRSSIDEIELKLAERGGV